MMNTVYKSGMKDEIGQGLQLKSQGELIGKDDNFKSRRIYKTRPDNNVSEKSDDEQFYDTRDGLTDPKEILNDKIDDFNKLNEVFSGRIKEINGNEPTGKVLKETKDGDNINENKKRVAQIKGSRG
ncbi:unnamed protein product [Rhizophagus irregularis]|nr:unnamed protein product [Rhizophagus irregularis]